MEKRKLAVAVLAGLAVTAMTFGLAACGGGGGGGNSMVKPGGGSTPSTPPTSSPPTSAPPTSAPPSSSTSPPAAYDPHNNQLIPTGALDAQKAGFTGAGIKVGVLDSGVDPTDPALNASDATHRNKVAWFKSYDPSVTDPTAPNDNFGHGTVTSQLIAGDAYSNSADKVQFNGGVAPGADLYVAQACYGYGSASGEACHPTAQVYNDLIAQGVKVISSAFSDSGDVTQYAGGASNPTAASTYALLHPVAQAGVLQIFGTGESGKVANPGIDAGLPYLFPDMQPSIIAVTVVALDANGKPTGLYTDGNGATPCGVAAQWCLSAPAEVYTVPASPAFTTGHSVGTSSGTAIVTGVAAQVWQAYPWMTAANMSDTLLTTATPIPGCPASQCGWGMVNAAKAVNGPAQFAFGDFDANIPSGATATFANDIGGAGSLTLSGPGTLMLTGNDTYSGGTTINAGALFIGNNGTTGSIAGDVTIGTNGTLAFNRSDDITFSGIVHADGGAVFEKLGAGRLVLTGNSPGTGHVHLGAGVLQVGDGSTAGMIPDNVQDDSFLVFYRSDNITFGGVIGGSGSIAQSGAGTLTLTNANTFTGEARITGGTLALSGSGSIADAQLVSVYGGTFDISGASGGVTINNLSNDEYLGGSVILGGNTLTVNEPGYRNFSGVISGTGGLVLTSGQLALGGENTYSGGTTINSGAVLAIVNLGTQNGSIAGDVIDNGRLEFLTNNGDTFAGAISGSGSVLINTSGTLTLSGNNTYIGGTSIAEDAGLKTTKLLPIGNVENFGWLSTPGVAGNLSNSGELYVRGGDTTIGGNYTQHDGGGGHVGGILAVSLGSKLAVTGTAALAGTLEITGKDSGYTANTHTQVLTAAGGVSGTFASLVKDTGVVFTSSTIQYGANEVWLDTTGLSVTVAAAGGAVHYTPASMGSAVRVQGAFEALDAKIEKGKLDTVSGDFVKSAGEFQQAPTLQAAQDSLESLSGQLYAASAGMTLQAIDATSRALSARLEDLAAYRGPQHTWARQLDLSGDMARSGYGNVDYQINGWLAGTDMRLGPHALAGFALSQGNGFEQLAGRFDRNRSQSAEAMAYAGWTQGRWYANGRVGLGHYHQYMDRMLLLGTHYQGVGTDFAGRYNVAYGEGGLHFGLGTLQLTPFADLEYDRVLRDGFVEQGAGGFGLKADAQTISRSLGGAGFKLARAWRFDAIRSLSVDAHVQWRRTLASSGTVFDASLVGMDEWRPLTGVGLSRNSRVFGLDLNAKLSANTRFALGGDYVDGDRGRAIAATANFSVAF